MTDGEKPVLVLFPKGATGEEILDIMRKMKAEAKKKTVEASHRDRRMEGSADGVK